MLKLAYSRAEPPRLDWIATIIEARQSLSDKLTPTLRPDAEAVLEKLYADGRKRAAVGLRQHGELDAADQLPPSCPWSLDEICEEDWYPTPAEPDRTS